MPKQNRLQSTAYHEAGHAVAAVLLRLPFKSVTIEPGEGFLGQVMLEDFLASFQPDIEITTRTRSTIEADCIVSFAGPAAEKKLTGRNNHRGASKDYGDAVNLAMYIGGDGEGTTAYLKWPQIQARRMIALPFHWKAVEALAAELLIRKTISARDCRKIIKASWCLPPFPAS